MVPILPAIRSLVIMPERPPRHSTRFTVGRERARPMGYSLGLLIVVDPSAQSALLLPDVASRS